MPTFQHVRSVSGVAGRHGPLRPTPPSPAGMAAIGLGTNLGDRASMLRRAVRALTEGAAPILRNAQVSGVFETPALLADGAPPEWNLPFYNLVITGECPHSPPALLHELKRIEHALGRLPRGHWAPREIDLDILVYGNRHVQSPVLSIPHPHLLARAFVLVPLAELWPDWRYPVPGPLAGSPLHALAEHYFPASETTHMIRLGSLAQL